MTDAEITDLATKQKILVEQSQILKSVTIAVSGEKSITLNAIATFESGETLDEKDKPTGKTEHIIYSTNGAETELTEAEYAVFKPYWNRILTVDTMLASVNLTLTGALFPQSAAQIPANV